VSRKQPSPQALGTTADELAGVGERLIAIEKALEVLVASHTALLRHFHTAGPALPPGLGVGRRLPLGMTPPGTLLVGWAAIASHCHKQPRTLRRYVAREGFPAFRWGRFVVSAPTTIADWLLVREQGRLRKQGMTQARSTTRDQSQ
jgi:hypothetical protein